MKKVLIWAVETIPLERNFAQAKLRKEKKYAKLKVKIQLQSWIVYDFTYEVGALGFVAKSFDNMLRSLGTAEKKRETMRKRVSKLFQPLF